MITQIGIISGELLNVLEENGDLDTVSLMALLKEKNPEVPPEVFYMAVGWLAREGYIVLIKIKEGVYRICLKK